MTKHQKTALWAAALLGACISAAVYFLTDPGQHETLQWAQELRAEDIVSAELAVMPQAADKQYRVFSAEEIPEVAALLNTSRGRHVSQPEELAGSEITLYVTTADGVRHTVSNEGNAYLYIDGDAYKPGYSWLAAWPYAEGNEPLPEGFFDDPLEPDAAGTGVMAGDRFYTKKWSIRVLGGWEKLGYFGWEPSTDVGSFFGVGRYRDLDGTIASWRAAGEAVEKLDGYYRYVRAQADQDDHVESYLYPVPDSGDYYEVYFYWRNKARRESDAAQIALEEKQLKLMAESFQMTDEVNSLTVLPLTGYEAYDALLARIADARAFDERDTDVFSYELLQGTYQTVGWTLRDLDGDGTPELLCGGDWGDGYTPIFNLYKLENGEAVQLLYGWARNRYWLCPDGTIANIGSSGASETIYSYYRYADGELKLLESVKYFWTEEGVSPWYYSDTSDEFWTEQPDGNWGRNPAFRRISERKAEQIHKKYEDSVTLDYAPFEGEWGEL